MRGTQTQMKANPGYGGIIPADAGSTYVLALAGSAYRDHPRGCGEHASFFRGCDPCGGSSPRMRGARPITAGDTVALGIIPADAGSTTCTATWRPAARDHPRGCGEHNLLSLVAIARTGSSPRMRGAPVNVGRELNRFRIIPADAGSTPPTPVPHKGWGDHPRGCGEHLRASTKGRNEPGSSPRMRGAPLSVACKD